MIKPQKHAATVQSSLLTFQVLQYLSGHDRKSYRDQSTVLALLQASCMVWGRLSKNEFNSRAYTWAPDSLPLHSILQSMLESEET